MASGRVVIELDVDAKGAVSGIRGVEGGLVRVDRAADRATKKVGLFSRGLAALKANVVIAGLAAVYGAFRLIGQSVGDARVQQVAEGKLAQALRNTGEAGAEAAEGLRKLAAETQNVSNYGDEAILTAQAMLLSFQEVGGSKGAAMLTGSLVDMAAGLEKAGGGAQDLNQIAATLGRALTTGSSALTRVGVSLTDVEKAAFDSAEGLDRVAILAEVVQNNFGGMAEATVDDSRQMKNAIGDLREALGEGLLKASNEVARALSELAQNEGVMAMVRDLGNLVAEGVRQFADFVRVLADVAAGLRPVNAQLERLDGNADAAGASARKLAYDLSTTAGVVRFLADALRWLGRYVEAAELRTKAFAYALRHRLADALADVLTPISRVSRTVERLVFALRAAQDAARLNFNGARAQLDALNASATGAGRALSKLAPPSKPGGGGGGGDAGGGAAPLPALEAPSVEPLEQVTVAAEKAQTAIERLRQEVADLTTRFGELSGVELSDLVALEAERDRIQTGLDQLEAAVRLGVTRLKEAGRDFSGVVTLGPDTGEEYVEALFGVTPGELAEAFAPYVEAARRGAKAVADGLAEEREAAEREAEAFGRAIEAGIGRGIEDLAVALGEFAVGAASFGDVGRSLVSSLGALAQQVGGMMIAFGVAALGLRKLLTNPYTAIAAGFALVALGSAARAAVSGAVSSATGGGGGGYGGGGSSRPASSSVAAGVLVGGVPTGTGPRGGRDEVSVTGGGTTVEVLESDVDWGRVRMKIRREDARVDRRQGR